MTRTHTLLEIDADAYDAIVRALEKDGKEAEVD